MHNIRLIAFISIALSSVCLAQTPSLQAKDQKEKKEGGATVKKVKVAYVSPHRRLSSVAMGKTFAEDAYKAAQETGLEEFKQKYACCLEAFINTSDAEGNTALHKVAFAGGKYADDVMSYLLACPSVNQELSNAQHHIPLMEAIRGGQLAMLDILAKHGTPYLSRSSIVQAQSFAVRQAQNACVARLSALLTECQKRQSQQSQLAKLAHIKGASQVFSQSQKEKILSASSDDRGLVADESQPSGCCCWGSKAKVHPVNLKYTAATPTTASN